MRIQQLVVVFFIVVSLSLCSCTASDNAKSESISSSEQTQSQQSYNQDFDTSIVAEFSMQGDYYDDCVAYHSENLKMIKELSLKDDNALKILNAYQKNYGELKTPAQVKLAAIEVFYRCLNDDSISVSDIKVYKDVKSEAWLAKPIREFMINGGVGGTDWVAFTFEGDIIAVINED